MNCDVGARPSGGGEASLQKAVRTVLAGSVALTALLTAGLDPASAAAVAAARKPAHAKREAAKKEPLPKLLEQPLIEISIARQQLTLYDKGVVIAHAPVSTGMAGHLTPTGIFSVIGKEIFHRSNIYSGAPMPFMQRITWSGVALHAGVLPGYPASHGCIRMPPAFAVKLYHMTKRGARVLVVHNEVPPAPFESARLFTRPKPAEKVSEAVAPLAVVAANAVAEVRAAETKTPSVMSDAVVASHVAPPPVQPTSPAATAPDGPGKGAKDPQAHRANDAALSSVKDAATPPATSDAANVTADAPAPQRAAPQTGAVPAQKNGEAATGTVLVNPVTVTPAHPIEVQKRFAPSVAPPAPTTAAPAPVVAPAPAVKASLEPYGPERPLRPGPITVFVSKKEGKLYVRKGFRPVFSAPISILHPEQRLGTHLFTAIEQNTDGVSFRWLAVTMPNEHVAKKTAEVVHYVTVKGHKVRKVEKVKEPAPPPSATAAEALERIEIPQAAREHISALMSSGASLIISDKGLGDETGDETDFIVLTSR